MTMPEESFVPRDGAFILRVRKLRQGEEASDGAAV